MSASRPPGRRRAHRLRRVATVGGLVLAGLAPVSPAVAHQSDPRITTIVDAVRPALPGSVVVQAQEGLATQLVVQNPTPAQLEVLGTGGRPFLRISATGVFGDVASADFSSTANPNGTPPPDAGSAPARWLQLSAGDSWGWYDHRLHPTDLPAPTDDSRAARLADFTVPLRYGQVSAEVRGHLQFQPLLGTFSVAADPAPAGLTLQALPGKLPGLFLANPERRQLTVLGRDGEPFLRFTPAGVEVNTASRTHVEDRQARGDSEVGPPGTTPTFVLAAPKSVSYQWLDSRLRYPAALPPDQVLEAAVPTVVERWSVPVQIAGARDVLSGEISWVPESAAAARTRMPDRTPPQQDRPWLPLLVVTGAGLTLLAAATFVRRRRPGS